MAKLVSSNFRVLPGLVNLLTHAVENEADVFGALGAVW